MLSKVFSPKMHEAFVLRAKNDRIQEVIGPKFERLHNHCTDFENAADKHTLKHDKREEALQAARTYRKKAMEIDIRTTLD